MQNFQNLTLKITDRGNNARSGITYDLKDQILKNRQMFKISNNDFTQEEWLNTAKVIKEINAKRKICKSGNTELVHAGEIIKFSKEETKDILDALGVKFMGYDAQEDTSAPIIDYANKKSKPANQTNPINKTNPSNKDHDTKKEVPNEDKTYGELHADEPLKIDVAEGQEAAIRAEVEKDEALRLEANKNAVSELSNKQATAEDPILKAAKTLAAEAKAKINKAMAVEVPNLKDSKAMQATNDEILGSKLSEKNGDFEYTVISKKWSKEKDAAVEKQIAPYREDINFFSEYLTWNTVDEKDLNQECQTLGYQMIENNKEKGFKRYYNKEKDVTVVLSDFYMKLQSGDVNVEAIPYTKTKHNGQTIKRGMFSGANYKIQMGGETYRAEWNMHNNSTFNIVTHQLKKK